ncbi:MAG: hypothetical protein WC840_01535 [Candidatus Peribacteraceae bacterium]
MITFSASSGCACRVSTGSVSFEVFPSIPSKDSWALLSHPAEEMKSKKVLSWPGEYDFFGITVHAIGQEQGRQIAYSCVTEGIRMAFIDTPLLDWSDADLERLGDIDVLVLAADNPKKITPLVEAADPRVILLFAVKGGDLAGAAKVCGLTQIQPVEEFKIKPSMLPTDTRQVVILK